MQTDGQSENICPTGPSSSTDQSKRCIHSERSLTNQSNACLCEDTGRTTANQSNEGLLEEMQMTNQSEEGLHKERKMSNESETELEGLHDERISNPCKRKRVPSAEYLDVIDKNDDFKNYFQCRTNTEKPSVNHCSSFSTTGSSSAGSSTSTLEPICHSETLDFANASVSTSERLIDARDLHLDRSVSENFSENLERTNHRLGENSESCPKSKSDFNIKFGICDSTTNNQRVSGEEVQELPSASCESVHREDDETGENSYCKFSGLSDFLPSSSGLQSSNQSADNCMDTIKKSSSDRTNPNLSFPLSPTCQSSTSLLTSPARKPFSISMATAIASNPTPFSSRELHLSASSSSSSDSQSSPSASNLSASVISTVSSAQRSNTHAVAERRGFSGVVFNKICLPVQEEENFFSGTSNNASVTPSESSVDFNIPSYLLIQIFQHLSMYQLLHNVACVCKLWYEISHDPALWRVIDLQNQVKVTDTVLLTLTSYSDRVIYLNLTDSKFISEDCVIKTVMKCQHLQTLKLSRCMSVTTDDVLAAVGRHCHNLCDLHVDVCYKVTDKGLESLAAGCPKLERIHLDQCQNIGNKGLVSLSDHCPLLKYLSLENCSKVEDEGIAALVNGCPDVRTINLQGSNKSDHAIYLLHKLKNLQTLDMSACVDLSVPTVCSIAQSCSKLQCLNLSLNQNVDDVCMEKVAVHCTQLRKLYVVSCIITNTGLEHLGQHCKHLRHLDLGWCRSISDDGVQFVSEHCPTLRYIGLIRCDQVTVERTEDLVKRFPHIHYSTFILDARKIIQMARSQGFQFPDND